MSGSTTRQVPLGMFEAMREREWYRSMASRLTKIVVALSVALVLCLLLCAFLIMNRPEPRYFAASTDFQIVEMTPLDQPLISQQELLNWAGMVASGVFTLDFQHWKEKLMNLRPHFTQEAFKTLVRSLKEQGGLDDIVNNRLVVSAVMEKAPVITNQGILKGKFCWQIQVPLVITFENSEGPVRTLHLIGNLLVQREDTTVAPKGLAVSQIVYKKS